MQSGETYNPNPIERLQSTFPNLINSTAYSDEKNPEKIVKKCSDLLAFAEIFDLEEKVHEIGIHGSTPVMWVVVGRNDSEQRIVEKIYNFKHEHEGEIYDTYELEGGWDPHNYEGYESLASMLEIQEGFDVYHGLNWKLTMKHPAGT